MRVLAINTRLGATGPGPSPSQEATTTSDAGGDASSQAFADHAIATLELDPTQSQVIINATTLGRLSLMLRPTSDTPQRRRKRQRANRQRRHPALQPLLDQMTKTTKPAADSAPLLWLIAAVMGGLFLAFATPTFAQTVNTVNYDLGTTSVMRINLPMSQAVTVIVSAPIGKVVAADPNIAEAQPITARSIYVVGKAFGTTTVNLFSDTGAPIGLLAIEVGADIADIQRSIRVAVPNSNVKVHSVNGRVQLSGTVGDATQMQKVLDIVTQYGSPQVVNTITLTGGQQVNLEVRILEAQRNAGRDLGIQWGGNVGPVNRQGQWRSERPRRATRPRSRPSSPTSSRAAASTSPPPSTRSKPRASSAPSPTRT